MQTAQEYIEQFILTRPAESEMRGKATLDPTIRALCGLIDELSARMERLEPVKPIIPVETPQTDFKPLPMTEYHQVKPNLTTQELDART